MTYYETTAYQLPDDRVALRLGRGINQRWYAYDDPSDAATDFIEATQHPSHWSKWPEPDFNLQLDAIGWLSDPDEGLTWLADCDPDFGIEVNQDFLGDLFPGKHDKAARDFCRMLTISLEGNDNAESES